MRFHQIKEVYQHILNVNKRFETLCEQLLIETKDERIRMYIYFLLKKQHDNNDYLKNLIKSESHKVIDSWVDEEIENKITKNFIEYEQRKILTVDDILNINLEIIEIINNWLLIIVDVSTNQTVKEHMLDLIERQTQQSHQLVHSAHRMDDM
ncbi:MAG: hypothetical protein ACJAXJ_002065 [Colwellia sp.]|jgi:hypothetical protein|tara:strand:- start:478 stop:933 length:456 start_codon:yes stop_codon:yes gene_type:complete